MNSTRQFWAVFKFQSTINPAIWVVPFAFSIPFLVPFFTGPLLKNYHSSLLELLGNQNLFLMAFFGSMILAPEKYQLGGNNLNATFYGTEFLLTRAIERSVLYRVKATLLYLLILVIPFLAILHSFRQPSLIVTEDSNAAQRACLAVVPNSTLLPREWKGGAPSLISLPHGKFLVAEWQLALILGCTLFFQLATMVLYPLRKAKLFFWGIFFGFIFLPFLSLRSISQNAPTPTEELFFVFAAHQFLFWLFAGLGFLVLQLWCERRFAQLEQ